MNDTSEGTRKHFVRKRDGQPVVYAGDSTDVVSVRIGPDGAISIMPRVDWEKLPPWNGPVPSWSQLG